MVRIASQEAFESAVKETMADFEMTQEDAITDVVEQFRAQGVDLSNVIKDLILSDPTNQHAISKSVQNINKILDDKTDITSELITELNTLKMECDKDIAHKLMASKEGAYETIIKCILQYEENDIVLLATLKCIVTLMEGQPDLLQIKDISIFNRLLKKNDDIIIETLRWISNCCLRHENNRQTIFKTKILTNFKDMMELHKNNPKILVELCTVLRHLVLDDDIRVEFGQAHEHARLIATDTLHLLTQMLADFKSHEDFVADILLTIATLVVRHEFCQKVDEAGGLQFIFDVMIEFHDKEKINRQCFKLLKALAGNDDVKRNIIKKGGAHLICSALDSHKEVSHSASFGLGCVSAIALREVENSKALFEAGLPEIIIQCINIHPNNMNIVRNASWAIRNMVTRLPENRPKFLELHAEDALNNALNVFGSEIGHDIKSALIDLGCNVKLNEQWTGKGGKIHTSENSKELYE